MKKLVSKALLLLGIVSFLQISWAQPRLKIGLSLALSGDGATWGTDMKNALLMAKDEFFGGDVEFILEDDKCDPKTAVAIANKFVSIDKVDGVLGYTCSGTLLAAAPIFERAKIPVVSSSASAAKISEAGEYIFRTFPSDSLAGSMLFNYIAKTKKNLGVLSTETEYCQGFVDEIKKANAQNKIEVTYENVMADDVDVKPLLLKFKKKGIDSIFINSQSDREFLRTLKQVRQLKLDIPVYSAYWGSSTWFVDQAKELSNGLITVDSSTEGKILNEEGKKVLSTFRKKFGEPNFSGALVAINWEAARALSEALGNKGDAKFFLEKAKFDGIFGPWHFDHRGDINGIGFSIKETNAGKVSEVD